MPPDGPAPLSDDDDDAGDWGPFGKPLFDDPSARALSRVGVVDVGSNSVRMVVFDGAARSPAYFYNEKIMCGLGKGLAQTGQLHPEGKARALSALKRFSLLAKGMDIAPFTVVATAATREATDGADFQAQVMRETGLKLHVIDGPEEARLSAQGVLLGWPGARGIVCDIGGNSMELARIGEGRVGKRVSIPSAPSGCNRCRAIRRSGKRTSPPPSKRQRKRSGPNATASTWSAAAGASSPGWTWSGGPTLSPCCTNTG